MNEILAMVDDLKSIKQRLADNDTPGAIKLIDECIAYKEKEITAFEAWTENEIKLDETKEQLPFEEQIQFPFPEYPKGVR
tara:strand:- start:515 stop:754 length:240 start_codon:yes stop_codon:yes gene_type:complete